MKKIFLLFGFCFSIIQTVNAQHKQVHDAMEQKYGEPGLQKAEEWMSNMMNAKTESSYDFPIFMNMHITSYRKGKSEETDMAYYINTAKSNFATTSMGDKKGKDMLMIYDMKNNSMLMLNTKDKTGMAININAVMSGEQIKQREQGTNGKKDANISCKKIGKTKTIQGYACEQYICRDEDRNTRSEIWITDKVPVNIAKSGSKGPMAAYFGSVQGVGGMMMEGEFYKNDNLEAKMEVTKIDPKANKNVNMSDYKMGMK